MATKSYEARQKEFLKLHDIKVGDYVKILGKADTQEDGWAAYWVDEMNRCVGNTYKISNISDRSGIRVREENANMDFPYWLVKKTSKLDVKVRLNSHYTAVVKDGYIQVGCQTIKFSAITELVERIGTLKKGKRKR